MTIRAITLATAIHALSALAVATAILTSSAAADGIKMGALVLRSGAVNTDANYKNQYTDVNGKLRFVSALCSADVSNKTSSTRLIDSDTTHLQNGLFTTAYGATQASTIINAGGTVVSKPLKGNPNHCEISGLSVAKIKGIWTMCTVQHGC